jgi:hypothetical protein
VHIAQRVDRCGAFDFAGRKAVCDEFGGAALDFRRVEKGLPEVEWQRAATQVVVD